MALSKKKSRPITVDGQDFRWQFYEDSGFSSVTVQFASGSGQKLVVQIPGPAHIHDPVTPAIVEHLIVSSMKLGWRPMQNGQTFNTVWEGSSLTVLGLPET